METATIARQTYNVRAIHGVTNDGVAGEGVVDHDAGTIDVVDAGESRLQLMAKGVRVGIAACLDALRAPGLLADPFAGDIEIIRRPNARVPLLPNDPTADARH